MVTAELIARLAHLPMSEHLVTLQAQLESDEPLDFALSTPSGSVLGCVMRLFCASYVTSGATQWVPCHGYANGGYQYLSGADFESVRSSLLSKLQTSVPGPESDFSRPLHLWLNPPAKIADLSVQPLVDDVIAALVAKGADPLATDAQGNNALLLLAKSGDSAQLIKLLQGRAPWKACGVETDMFHHNGAGQTVRSSSDPNTAEGQVGLALIRELEAFWTQRIKPTLIHTLTHDLGMAKDAAILCAQYIDGSGSGGGGKSAESGEERKEADAAAAQ